jgi:hypothetical protein
MKTAAAIALTVSLLPSALFAQTTWTPRNPRDPKQPVTVSITLHPVAPVAPDLRYQLLPRFLDTLHGNAALGYAAAISAIPADRPNDESDTLDALRKAPLETLDETAAKPLLDRYAKALAQLRAAARYDHVDWQTPIRTEGFAAFSPQLGPLRNLSSVLILAIRLDLKHRDFPAAHDKLQTGFALARHLSQGDTLIQSLVATAILGQMTRELEEWIGTPDAPNLFWPIAYLPRNLVDFSRALAAEKDAAYFASPEFRQMRRGITTNDSWRTFANALQTLGHGGDPAQATTLEPWKQQAVASGFALLFYPVAKQYLVDHGAPAAEVEKLSVADALGKYFPQSFDEAVDETFKYLNLPPAQSLPALSAAETRFSRSGGLDTNLLARLIIPSLSRAAYLHANSDRVLDMLQTVEALRAHAATHETLPAQLTAIELPLLLDPFTDKPFTYTLQDNTAILTSTPAMAATPLLFAEPLQYTLHP